MKDSKVVIEVIEVLFKKLKDGEDQRHEEFMRLLDCCEKLTADSRQAADDMRERVNEHE